MALRRGEVYAYLPVLPRPGQSLYRLIISAEGLNDSPIPVVLGLHVVEHDPSNLLAIHLESHGWAVVTTIEAVMKRRLGELAGVVSMEEMQAVDNALKAAMDLD